MNGYIPLKNKRELQRIHCPFTVKTLYKYRYMGTHPRLTVKIGGTVCLNVGELERMARRSIEEQKKRAKAKSKD